MAGWVTSPVTGGLFLQGGEAEDLRDVATTFPITQDQRNTLSASARYDVHRRVWVSGQARYGSGLPVELEEDEGADAGIPADAGLPADILARVDFARGRVKPNFNLDFSVGATVWRRDKATTTLQFDLVNATDRLNVINFTGLFSGTALAPSRMAALKLRARF